MSASRDTQASLERFEQTGPVGRASRRQGAARRDVGDPAHDRGPFRRLWAGRSRRRLRALSGPSRVHRPAPALVLLAWAARHRWRAALLLAAPLSATVSAFAGDTAGVIAGVYAAAAIVVATNRQVERARLAAFERGLDAVARLAAELRAGADPTIAVGRALPAVRDAGSDPGQLASRVTAATTVAEQTGAPLSDLLDRLEADASAAARVRALAAGHAAGARATAWLLAALPLAGIALGSAIGADSMPVLLHTRVGAVAAVLAVGLQLTGMVWIRRLGRRIGGEQ
ncbi:MAG TPA: hypothetical protein VKB69_05320 [Micromonosporaceae bacterium]|nr:hypothetical protein [Micromonosporaceae bacterium]